jgi:mannosyltransferase OCH1-like enzyme
MIPKRLHLCWLSGDPFPPLIQHCVESWKRHLPDYEIVRWDSNSFDLNHATWVREAFNNKKYAFAADYIRLFALHKMGGIYLDADVEVTGSFEDFVVSELVHGLRVIWRLGTRGHRRSTRAALAGAVLGTLP